MLNELELSSRPRLPPASSTPSFFFRPIVEDSGLQQTAHQVRCSECCKNANEKKSALSYSRSYRGRHLPNQEISRHFPSQRSFWSRRRVASDRSQKKDRRLSRAV